MSEQYENIASDQTAFAAEEPLFDLDKPKEKKPGIPKVWLAVGGLGTFLIVGFTLSMFIRRPEPQQQTPTVEITPTPPADLPRIDKMIQELKMDIDNADPANQSFALPPVSEEIFIEK